MVVTCPRAPRGAEEKSKKEGGRGLRAPVQRKRKIMRCFCIIRYTDSLSAGMAETGIRPEHPAGCNEKSPSIARGSTYFRVKPSPSLSSVALLSSSPSGLNLRVSETGRAVPKARASRSPPPIRPALIHFPLSLFSLSLSPF